MARTNNRNLGRTPAAPASKGQAIACVVGCSILLGVAPVLIQGIYGLGMGASEFVLVRSLSAVVVGVLVCVVMGRPLGLTGRPLACALIAAACFGAANLLIGLGLETTSSGLANVLFHLFPVFVLVATQLVLRQHVRPAQWIAAFVMLGGIALVFAVGSGWAFTVVGVIEVTLSAVFYAGYTMLLASRPLRGVAPTALTVYACAGSALVSAVALPFASAEGLRVSALGIGLTVVLACVFTVVPLALYAMAAKTLSSGAVSLFANLEPAVTVGAEAIALQQLPGWGALAGCAIVVGASVALGRAETDGAPSGERE